MYVVVDYHTHDQEVPIQSVPAFVNAWNRLWGGLSCLPNWGTDLKGRVLLDLLNEPGGDVQRTHARTHATNQPSKATSSL